MKKEKAMSGSSTGLEISCDKCGKVYAHPKRLANHALRCTGKIVQTRGRIDRLAHRPVVKTKSKRVRLPARKAGRAAPQPKPTGDGRYDAVIADLRAKRDRIDAAISQLEALA